MNLDLSLKAIRDIFVFPFHDPKWQDKLLTGSALFFAGFIIPVLPSLAALGFIARVVRAGERNSDPTVLPEWSDWGGLMLDGLRLFGVSFFISLPSVIILMIGQGIYLSSFVVMTSTQDSAGAAGIGLVLAFLVFFLTLGVGIALSLLSMLLLPPAMAHVAVNERFGAFFRVGEWWRILRANLSGFLAALFFVAGLYVVLLFAMQVLYLTLILCLAIPLLMAPMLFYMMVVFGRLTGQAYGEGARRLNPQPAAADEPPVADAPLNEPGS